MLVKRSFIGYRFGRLFGAWKNIPFRKAHFIVGNVVAQAEAQGIDISEIKDLSKIDPVFDEKAMELLNFWIFFKLSKVKAQVLLQA